MNQATQTLQHEHEAISLGLKILTRMEQRMGTEDITDIQDLSSMTHFLKAFADTCHHGKEESIFFPALRAQDPSQTQQPVQRLLADIGNVHLIEPLDYLPFVAAMLSYFVQMVQRALRLEGTCTGEHGIGLHKMDFLRTETGEGAIQMMRTIKHALDPHNIMNPGKIFSW